MKINVWFYASNFIYKYNSFSFQSVIFSLSFIVIVFTWILLVILNSNYWLCFILIFYAYNSKELLFMPFHLFLYLWSSLLLIFILPRWVCLSPCTIAPFHCHRCWLLSSVVYLCLIISLEYNHSLDLLITLEVIFWEIILLLYIIIFFSKHNGFVSPSPLFIVIFWSFPVNPPHRWVQPLTGFSHYIGSTFLSNCNITIYHHCFLPTQRCCFTVTVVDC